MKLSPALSLAPFTFFAILLAACPQGDPLVGPGQDGGADAAHDGAADADAAADAAGAEAGAAAGAENGSALCGANGRNDCGAFLVCAPGLGCVACASDGDCPVAEPACVEGTCVGCNPGAPAAVTGCPPARSACWSSDDECHPSCVAAGTAAGADAGACPAGTTCDEVSRACVGCRPDVPGDCSDPNASVCDPARRICVECVADGDCASAPGTSRRPRCRTLTGACVACTSNADCGLSAPTCDPTTFTCVKEEKDGGS